MRGEAPIYVQLLAIQLVKTTFSNPPQTFRLRELKTLNAENVTCSNARSQRTKGNSFRPSGSSLLSFLRFQMLSTRDNYQTRFGELEFELSQNLISHIFILPGPTR